MSSKLLLIPYVVLYAFAFGLALAAERRRSIASIVEDPGSKRNYCMYDSDISTGLGIGAFLFLMASQILIMGASRCFCCGKPLRPGRARSWTLIFFITSWLFFLIAEICLLAGSVRNAYHTKYRTMFTETPPSCQMLRKGVFGAGAAFVFLNSAASQFYYYFYSKARESFQAYNVDSGVRMSTI